MRLAPSWFFFCGTCRLIERFAGFCMGWIRHSMLFQLKPSTTGQALPQSQIFLSETSVSLDLSRMDRTVFVHEVNWAEELPTDTPGRQQGQPQSAAKNLLAWCYKSTNVETPSPTAAPARRWPATESHGKRFCSTPVDEEDEAGAATSPSLLHTPDSKRRRQHAPSSPQLLPHLAAPLQDR